MPRMILIEIAFRYVPINSFVFLAVSDMRRTILFLLLLLLLQGLQTIRKRISISRRSLN